MALLLTYKNYVTHSELLVTNTTISDACKLPKVKGACQGYHLRWYFDAVREQCGQFVFGGCLGNANNFESRELCQEHCEPVRSDGEYSIFISLC